MEAHSGFFSQHNRNWKEKITPPANQTYEILFADFWDKKTPLNIFYTFFARFLSIGQRSHLLLEA